MTILKNVLYLIISNVFIRLLSALSMLLIARYLSQEDYGIFSIGMSLYGIFIFLSDMGTTSTILRDGTKSNVNINKLFSNLLLFKLISSFTIIFIIIIFLSILYSGKVYVSIILLLSFALLGNAFISSSSLYYQVQQKMKYTAIILGLNSLANALSLILSYYLNLSIVLVCFFYGLSSFLVGILILLFLKKKFTFKNNFNFDFLKGINTFAVGGFITIFIPQIGTLILEKVSSLTEVGIFSAAVKIPLLLYQIPGIIATAFYPELFKLYNDKMYDRHQKLNNIQIRIMGYLGIMMFIPVYLYAEDIIQTFLGYKWLNATSSLKILSMLILLQSLSYPLADNLTTSGKQKKRTKVLIIGFIIGLISHGLLGKEYGNLGASVASVLIDFCLFIGYFYYTPNKLSKINKSIIPSFIFLVINMIIGFFIYFNININFLLKIIISIILMVLYILIFEVKSLKILVSIKKGN